MIKTIKIKKKYKYYEENGIKCDGVIKDIKVVESHTGLVNTYENRYEIVYLITDFKKIKKLTDSVKCQNNEECKKNRISRKK